MDIHKINKLVKVGLPSPRLKSIEETVRIAIESEKIENYDSELHGIILDVQNIKILDEIGCKNEDDLITYVHAEATLLIYTPQIGTIIKGVVTDILKDPCRIGVRIYHYRVVKALLQFPNQDTRKNVKINSEFEFRIKNFDLQRDVPLFEGELIANEEELPSVENKTKNQLDEEVGKISDDESSAESGKQIISQNEEEEERCHSADDFNIENVYFFNQNAEESKSSKIELLINEVHNFDAGVNLIEQNKSGNMEQNKENFNEVVVKQNTANDEKKKKKKKKKSSLDDKISKILSELNKKNPNQLSSPSIIRSTNSGGGGDEKRLKNGSRKIRKRKNLIDDDGFGAQSKSKRKRKNNINDSKSKINCLSSLVDVKRKEKKYKAIVKIKKMKI